METDAPYLAPVPKRGKTNEPAFVAHTAAKVAELKGVGLAELEAATTGNFFRLFAKAERASVRVTILGCGDVGRRAGPGGKDGKGEWGAANPRRSAQPPPALFHPGRAPGQDRAGRHLARSARPASGRRGRADRRRDLDPRACRPGPRHRRRAALHAAPGTDRGLVGRAHPRDPAAALPLLLRGRGRLLQSHLPPPPHRRAVRGGRPAGPAVGPGPRHRDVARLPVRAGGLCQRCRRAARRRVRRSCKGSRC